MIRGETPGGEEFIAFFRNSHGNFDTINFALGTFDENVEKAHKNNTPFLVYIHVENPNLKELINLILQNQKLRSLVNKSF